MGDFILAMGSPFGVLSPMHFFNRWVPYSDVSAVFLYSSICWRASNHYSYFYLLYSFISIYMVGPKIIFLMSNKLSGLYNVHDYLPYA